MKIQDQMERLLQTTPGLDLVAFGDVASGLILNWAARTRRPREALDLLGESAATWLALPPPDQAPAGFASSMIHFTEQETQIFARHAAGAEDVVCAVCEPGAALEPLLLAATGFARNLAGAT